jgi:hypothetical protein
MQTRHILRTLFSGSYGGSIKQGLGWRREREIGRFVVRKFRFQQTCLPRKIKVFAW